MPWPLLPPYLRPGRVSPRSILAHKATLFSAPNSLFRPHISLYNFLAPRYHANGNYNTAKCPLSGYSPSLGAVRSYCLFLSQ